jgi:hypothetical protein
MSARGGAPFQKVGLIWRASQPKWTTDEGLAQDELFVGDPPTHILYVVPDPGAGDDWAVDIWVKDDAEAKRRARILAGLVSPAHRVRAIRASEPGKALIGIRAFGRVE